MTENMSGSISRAKFPAKVAMVSIYPTKGSLHPEAGGVASYTHNLCTALEQQGSQVSVICDTDSEKSESYIENNIRVIRAFRKNLTFFLEIAKAIRRVKPDVMHVQQELSLYGGIVSAFLLPFAILLAGRTRKVVTLHAVVSQAQVTPVFVKENNSSMPPIVVKIAFRLLYGLLSSVVSRIIVHEAPFRDRLVSEYHVHPEKISVIPHGVELQECVSAETAKAELGINSTMKVLLFLGYLTGYKGIDLLIDGYAQFLKQNPAANTLLLIGAGKHPKLKDDPLYLRDSYERLQQKATDLLPETSYRWSGFVPEEALKTYYSASELSIYPYTVAMSSSGPMAMSIAYQVPFIASDVFAEFFDYNDHFFERTPESFASVLARTLTTKDVSDLIVRLRAERAWPAVAEQHAMAYTKQHQEPAYE